jgi:hypothetical protein
MMTRKVIRILMRMPMKNPGVEIWGNRSRCSQRTVITLPQ